MGRDRLTVKPSAKPTLVRTQHLPPETPGQSRWRGIASAALTLKASGAVNRLLPVVGHTWARSGPSSSPLAAPATAPGCALSCGNVQRWSLWGVLAVVARGWQSAVRARECGPGTDIWRTGSGRYRRFAEPLAFGQYAGVVGQRARSICRLRLGARLRLGRAGLACWRASDQRRAVRSETRPAMARWVSS